MGGRRSQSVRARGKALWCVRTEPQTRIGCWTERGHRSEGQLRTRAGSQGSHLTAPREQGTTGLFLEAPDLCCNLHTPLTLEC